MATIMSPTFLSPASFKPSENTQPQGQKFRSSSTSQLPLQETVSSSSQIFNSPPKAASLSHVASHQYVEQHRQFVDHQRSLHNEERALWNTERQELHIKIAELEAQVRQLRVRCGSLPASPGEQPFFKSNTFGSFARAPRTSAPSGLRASSTSSSGGTGDEFWRGAGGMADSHPTRTFSESSDTSNKTAEHLPSITEAAERVSKQKSVDFEEPRTKAFQAPISIPGSLLSSNLDGISFKSSGLPPAVVQSIMVSSPSPLHSPSPISNSGPRTPEASRSSGLNIPITKTLLSQDPYTKDAGHTPLAKYTFSSSSTQATPTVELKAPDQPSEPRPSVAAVIRLPTERSNSYFPHVDNADVSLDEDPALVGPLTLTNEEGPKDSDFLAALNAKLKQVAEQSPNELEEEEPTARDAEASVAVERVTDQPSSDDDNIEGRPEPEVKLRMKRSTNFGSVFGANSCGKGF